MLLNYKTFAIPTAFATNGIGTSDADTLPSKLQALAAAGFDAIELSISDVLAYANLVLGRSPAADDYDALVSAASQIAAEAERVGLRIITLQVFERLEGWERGSKEHEEAFRRLRGWAKIMRAAGTDVIQVAATDAPAATGASADAVVEDLAEAADVLAEMGGRIAFENRCGAVRDRTWREAWEVVRRADRANLGLCLDAFESAGGEWMGSIARGDVSDTAWRHSLAELSATVPLERIFLVQVSGVRGGTPVDGASRPLPGEGGGHLPVREFVRAVLETGFEGWLSVEVFDEEGQREAGRKEEEEEGRGGMEEYARRGMVALEGLLRGE